MTDAQLRAALDAWVSEYVWPEILEAAKRPGAKVQIEIGIDHEGGFDWAHSWVQPPRVHAQKRLDGKRRLG